MKLLAIDPGNTTGFALFSKAPTDSVWDKIKIGCRTDPEQVDELILSEVVHLSLIVIEEFKLFPWKSKSLAWSQLTTSQVIGRVKALAKYFDIEVKEQSTGNRDIGYMWGEVPHLPKSNPSNHAHDAWAHAAYYIIKNGGKLNG